MAAIRSTRGPSKHPRTVDTPSTVADLPRLAGDGGRCAPVGRRRWPMRPGQPASPSTETVVDASRSRAEVCGSVTVKGRAGRHAQAAGPIVATQGRYPTLVAGAGFGPVRDPEELPSLRRRQVH